MAAKDKIHPTTDYAQFIKEALTQYTERFTPQNLRTPILAEQFTQIMEEEGVTLADLLAGLAEEREIIHSERQTGGA